MEYNNVGLWNQRKYTFKMQNNVDNACVTGMLQHSFKQVFSVLPCVMEYNNVDLWKYSRKHSQNAEQHGKGMRKQTQL